MKKTKYQQILDAPKGCVEYNPSQSFALHVNWIVRSPTAAKEMIEKGFIPCAKATIRDTPTTLGYFFRIARDQRLAAKLKEEIKTIGQHPHYQPAFKSIQMGIPRPSVEMKLRHGGIDLKPLDWSADEPIEGHVKELDFDPIVLECTEIYLDNRSFYEHSASHEWMNNSPEILKACRSLKPTTFCIGNPSNDIWEKALESYLKAIRFEENKQVSDLHPGIYFCKSNKEGKQLFYLEFDLNVHKNNLKTCHETLSSLQKELEALYMIILPLNVHEGIEQEYIQVRVMLTFVYTSGLTCTSLKLLNENMEGQLIYFEETEKDLALEAQQFLGELTNKITIVNGHTLENSFSFAGYLLHPLFQKITANENVNYTV